MKRELNGRLPAADQKAGDEPEKIFIIPPARTRYLSEISETNRAYDQNVISQARVAERLYGLYLSMCTVGGISPDQVTGLISGGLDREVFLREDLSPADRSLMEELLARFETEHKNLNPHYWDLLRAWPGLKERYKEPVYSFTVRGKTVDIETHSESLSHLQIPRVVLPRYRSWGEILAWSLQENVPGAFPYTAGLYPFKRKGEDPTRMFAGEGGPERTNRRFHYVSLEMPAKRLSTAFDSVTLYGQDPGHRPDIYGKIGNAGVSICCLDDAKKLYSGFDLSDPKTSVSMTINGPAPMLLGFFLNAAIDQNCEKYIKEQGLEKEVEKKIVALYKDKGMSRPVYHGELPEGNDGLGLMLLGVTGDQVLPAEVYEGIRARYPEGCTGNSSGRYPQGRSGAEHLYFLHGVRPSPDGGCAGVFYRKPGAEFLLRFHIRLPYCGGRGQPDYPIGLYALQWIYLCGILPEPGYGYQ